MFEASHLWCMVLDSMTTLRTTELALRSIEIPSIAGRLLAALRSCSGNRYENTSCFSESRSGQKNQG